MSKYLTKSDFIASRECDRKLYYKKNNYSNDTANNEFMSLLAEGGLLVSYVAKMLFKDGQEVNYYSNEANITMTDKLIKDNKNITLFGATFRSGKLLTKTDIIVKKGNTITLYDVHSSSFEGDMEQFFNKNGSIKADKIDILEDISFQINILQQKYPEFKIRPVLMVLDKTKKSKYPNLMNNFKFEKSKDPETGELCPIIEFTGLKREIVTDNDLFIRVDASEAVKKIMPSVIERTERLLQYFESDTIKYPAVRLKKECKTCEFSQGKEECWANMPKHEHDIFDLYYNTTQKIKGEFVLNELINERKTSLFDWPIQEITQGKISERQQIQIENTQNNTEYFDKTFLAEIESFKYPLHFIDFETTRPAIPHNNEDRPYELLAFQWSCHTLTAPGAELIHKEWISFEKGFPNFKFAESLMKHLKSSGTIFMWHTHEKSVLKEIKDQMVQRRHDDEKLFEWIDKLLLPEDKSRLKDMNRMAKDYYFHPEMKGQTSIKKVLPAVWNNSPFIKLDYNVQNFFKPETLNYKDPYKILEENPELRCKQFEKINVGTDAIVAYQQMMRDLYMGDHENASQIKKMLIEYCKLDTFAMYIIWIHWTNSLFESRDKIINKIFTRIRTAPTLKLDSKTVLVRDKDLFKGIKIGKFRGLENAELRSISLYQIEGEDDKITFDVYHTNVSNSRIVKPFSINQIPTELLKEIEQKINSEECHSLNDEYLELEAERKELQTKALVDKKLKPKESDRLRELNNQIQQIIDNYDRV